MNDPLARRSTALGWVSSLAVHAALLALSSVSLTPPDTGFEFQVPDRIELGFVEATEVEAPGPALPTAEPEPVAADWTPTGGGTVIAPRDPDAGPRRRPRPDSGLDAGPAEPGLGTGPPVAFLPPGAQVALRIDMDRIRSSQFGDDVRRLLRVIPEWRALLGDSGIDPVRDLSRLLVASPNLRQANLVVAGRLAAEAPDPRAVAERIASSRGVPVEWHEQSGVPATAWLSADGTVRELALIGERHFVIARPDDLPRVLAIAAARSAPRAQGRRPAPPPEDPAEALLSMGDGEGLLLEIENVAAFLRRSPCIVPQRLRAGLVEVPGGVALRGEARFATAAEAEEAQRCLLSRAQQAAQFLIVQLYGVDGPLRRLDLVAEDATLRIETEFRDAELRTILGLLRGLLEPAAEAAPGSPSAPPPRPEPVPAPPPAEPPPSPYE
jgi:hypothetical protein